MSFLSCIGKKSKKKKNSKNEPLDRKKTGTNGALKKSIDLEFKDLDDATESQTSSTSLTSASIKKSVPNGVHKSEQKTLKAENEKLQIEIDNLQLENRMLKTECEKNESNEKSYQEEVRAMEATILDLKSKQIIVETETARLAIENQKLLQKIVGMEENQAMMSRSELQSMISQLEEAELKTINKPAMELSGIKTNPVGVVNRKKLTQEDRQMSWRLSNAETRLSQTEDENKRLRDDLKDMLDTHSELQIQIVSTTSDTQVTEKIEQLNSQQQFQMPSSSTSDQNVAKPTSIDTQPDHYLVDRLMQAEAEQSLMKMDNSMLEDSINDLINRLNEAEAKSKDEEIAMAEAATAINNDNGMLLKRISYQEIDQVKLKNDINVLESSCEVLSGRIDKLVAENGHQEARNEELVKQNKNLKNEIETLQQDLVKFQNENQSLLTENKKTQKRRDLDNKNVNVDMLQANLADVQQKYNDANQRLKELTKPTVQIKNLDIATPSPPTLAGRFRRELYEQKWMEAYTFLTGKLKREEKKTIQTLAEICTESYLYCKRAARFQIETLTSSLVSPTSNQYRSGQFSKRNGVVKSLQDQLPDDLRRRLLQYRSRPSQDMLNSGLNDFLNQIDYDRTRYLRNISEREMSEIMPFISTCFEISWCMAVQEPPMYLLFKLKHGVDVDEDKFDKYQSRGQRVDYVIWPAVFTSENGECLQKGVVQTLPVRA